MVVQSVRGLRLVCEKQEWLDWLDNGLSMVYPDMEGLCGPKGELVSGW
jgi:hypothetical protein